MKPRLPVNQARHCPRLVGVIASPAALVRATRLRRPPDFFELRLDSLRDSLGEIERSLPRLHAPLIFTARHSAEGGYGSLGTIARRELLERFLPRAAYLDLELRSLAEMEKLLGEMRRRSVGLLLSRHYLRDTPLPDDLVLLARSAAILRPAFFKLVTRTDTPAQLARLLTFFREAPAFPFSIAAMGIGQLGRESRRQLARRGSALLYGSVGEPVIAGQPSLTQLRRDRRAYI